MRDRGAYSRRIACLASALRCDMAACRESGRGEEQDLAPLTVQRAKWNLELGRALAHQPEVKGEL